MTRLLLVRHGETAWNQARRYQGWSELSLNRTGRKQALQLAQRLKGVAIDAFYASDLRRAWQTAMLISRNLQLAPLPEPRLREIGFGVVEGLTFAEADARYPAMMSAWLDDDNRCPAGAETMGSFADRLATFLADVKRQHQEETVLLVAHGGSMRELLRQALRLPPEGRWLFAMDTGSISELLLYEERGLLSRLNDISHLHEEKK